MSKRWLMIADAHLTCREPEDGFFRMLDGVSRLPDDIGIIFLGDIFDLWIALRGYENDEHRRFLAWCRKEKKRRQIVFLEGNHEFFVAKTYADAFTYAGEDAYREGDLLWLHGDRINKEDHAYAFLRFILRNRLTRWLLKLAGPTFGPSFAHVSARRTRRTNVISRSRRRCVFSPRARPAPSFSRGISTTGSRRPRTAGSSRSFRRTRVPRRSHITTRRRRNSRCFPRTGSPACAANQ